MNYGNASVGQKLTGEVRLSDERLAMVKQTYAYLAISVLAAIAGARLGSTTPALLNLFTGALGWILAMVLLNVIPHVALACRHRPVLGLVALAADGFVAGLVLGPAVAIAGYVATGQNIVLNALALTFLVFAAVSIVVWGSDKRYSAPRGLMAGIAISIVGAIVLNLFIPIGFLGMIISVGIGIFGVMVLVYATSDLLYNEAVDSPVTGAVMLFAGLFNVFTAILHILLMLFGGGRD